MKRKEFVRSIVDLLKESNIKKSVHVPRHRLYISDDTGTTKAFTVKGADKEIAFTSVDVGAVVDAAIKVILDTLAHGDNVSIKGFGSLGLQYRKERSSKQVGTGEDILIAGRYVPKFVWGNDLRIAARMFETYLSDKAPEEVVIEGRLYDTEFDDEEDDYEESIDDDSDEDEGWLSVD